MTKSPTRQTGNPPAAGPATRPSSADYPVEPAALAGQQERIRKLAAAGANALKSPSSGLASVLRQPPATNGPDSSKAPAASGASHSSMPAASEALQGSVCEAPLPEQPGVRSAAGSGWLARRVFRGIFSPVAHPDAALIRAGIFLGISALIFDSIRPLLCPDWPPRARFGLGLGLIYLFCNAASLMLAVSLPRFFSNVYSRSLGFSLCVLISGVLGCAYTDWALLPLVWHGCFAFFGAAALLLNGVRGEIQKTWVETEDLEVRKQLNQELQWAFAGLGQVLVAFAAISSISTAILLKGADLHNPDVKATGMQISLGILICLMVATIWGMLPGLETMRWARKHWKPGP